MDARSPSYSPPRQERSRQSFDRYLDAAEALIRANGFDELSVAEVARLAGFSVGGLYSRFPNKLALLGAVRERFLARMEAAVAAEFEAGRGGDASLAGAVHRIIRMLVRHFVSEPAMFRAFILECADNPEFAKRCEVGDERRKQLFREAVLAHEHEIRASDPSAAVDWAYTVVNLLIRERVIFGQSAPLAGGYADEELAENLEQITLAYLTHGGAVPS